MPSNTLTPRLLAITLLGAAALGFAATPAMADAKSPTVFEQGAVKIIQKKASSESGRRDVATNHRGHRHEGSRNGRRGDDSRNGHRSDHRADHRRRERKAERRRAERRAERQAERRRQRRWERRRNRHQSSHYSPWSNHGGWGSSNRHRNTYTSSVGISFNFGNDGYSRRRWSSSPHAFYNSNYGSYSTYSNQTYCERVLVQARHHGHYETVSVKQCSNPWDGTYIIQGSERVVNCLY